VKARLHYLDNLRTFAVMLVLLHHTAITYGASGSWYYHEVENVSLTSIILTLYCAVDQAFFMGLLFFISGYFTPISFDRKGAARFLRDKLIRLGIPLLFYAFVLGPMLEYYLYFRDDIVFSDFYRQRILTLKNISFGPLWFVEALLIVNFLYAGWKVLIRSAEGVRIQVFPSRRAAFPAAFLTGVAAFCLRLIWPTGTNFLQMQLGYFASYMVLFAFGILGYRRGWLEAIPPRTVRFWSWTAMTAILLLPVFVVFGGAISGNIEPFQGGFYWQAAVYSLWEPFVAFGIILFLLSFFRHRLDRTGILLRALSESSYTAYIIHPPVIVGISLLAQGAMVPPLFKFVIVGAAGIAVCFMVSYLITRIPGVKRVL
jgi:surface polysaccharide O-acyltransferase-like enzyme